MCSRAQALGLIATGRVVVNGRVSQDPALRVSLEDDRISVDGQPAKAAGEPLVIALHKPTGYVTTRTDPQGRKTVYELLPKLDRFVFPVGRLDKETSGLLIFTDDHRLGEALTNPDAHVPKTYEVAVDRPPDPAALESLRKGLEIGKGERTRPAIVEIGEAHGNRPRLTLTIHEGKNRQIRRMMAAVGLSVMSLRRVGIGGLRLGELASGEHRMLLRAETDLLRRGSQG